MRTKSSIKNLIFAIAGQSIGLIISFLARIVFIQILGTEYLGLSGLFTNILTVLSLVELGIGPALAFSLYKPLAEKNEEKLKSLMNLYKKAYISIGVILLVLGIVLTPFLDVFFKSKPVISNIELIFVLFLINSSISYFYSYKRNLIIADQKRYIATIYRYSFFILLNLIQIIVLYLTQNFIYYLICQIIATFAENYLISKKADALYPFLTDTSVQKLDKETVIQIKKNVSAMIAHRFGGVIVNSTDNVIISIKVGLVGVGLYSNYLLIINALNTIFAQVFSSITASVGNLGVTESIQKKLFIFNVVFLINFWIYGFISICLVILINPMIELWLGEKYLLNSNITTIIILNFYLMGLRSSILTFRDALGIYWYDRHKPLFEAVIKIIASYFLAKEYGLMGVFIGTTISTITTSFWVEPLVVYRFGFKTTSFPFFRRYFFYAFIGLLTLYITSSFTKFFSEDNIVSFMIILLICLILPNVIFLLFFYRTPEFKYLYKTLSNIFSKKLN